MGFNSVAFLLNNYMHDLERSPRSVAYLLAHPGADEHHNTRSALSNEFAEPIVHSQALEILPTFHADNHKFFMAGGNCITELRVTKVTKSKDGKKTVTVEMPDWFNEKTSNLNYVTNYGVRKPR